MRKQLLKTLAGISFLIAVAILPVSSAHAQTIDYRLRANIPFDFVVANQTLPAGEYFFARTRQYAGDSLVTISNLDGRALAVTLTSTAQTLTPKSRGVMVFNRYGTQHFLSQVWPAGTTIGRAVLKTRNERNLEREAKNIARKATDKAPATETVSVIASSR